MWAPIESIAPKTGCVSQTLHEWVRKHEVDTGMRDGVTSAERKRVKALEREVRELRKANEILRLPARFLPRRSSTTDSSPERFHRPALPHLRDRADLQGVADCPLGLSPLCCTADESALRCVRSKRDDILMPESQVGYDAPQPRILILELLELA